MAFSVYVLYSPKWMETYVGQTDDVEKRVRKHNAGRVKSTKAFRPWLLVHQERFELRVAAMRREKWLKMPSGRKFISSLISKWNEGGGLSDSAKLSRDLVPTTSERTKPALWETAIEGSPDSRKPSRGLVRQSGRKSPPLR